jgi:predicted dehydrogenase
MTKYRVGIIGCGRRRRADGSVGFGMSHGHAVGYETCPDTEIVALADIKRENAEAFQQVHGGRIYEDYREMLAEEKPDIVSISTWPHLHAPMVIACGEAGVKAVHCEKPMAPTWGESRRMVEVCQKCGTQLSFNHQRRFGEPFRRTRELIREGAIGTLERMESSCSNLYDWGTHWFDMQFFFNDETPAEWVMGQIDARGSREIFGVLVEGQGISHFGFENGVLGTLITGENRAGPHHRLTGSDGIIEVGGGSGVALRMLSTRKKGWQNLDNEGEQVHGGHYITRAILDVVESLKTGREPELSARRALRATELIFATYESCRRRARVDLPLEVDDSPFLSMVESGDLVRE